MKKQLIAAASALFVATSVPASATYYNWPSQEKQCEFVADYLNGKLSYFDSKYGSWKQSTNTFQRTYYNAHKYLFLKKILAWKHDCFKEIICAQSWSSQLCDEVVSPVTQP